MGKLWSKIRLGIESIAGKMEGTLFPGLSCDVCGRELQDNSIRLCPDCFSRLNFHNKEICVRCGRSVRADEVICDDCKGKQFAFNRAISVCDYGEVSGVLVKEFKFDGKIYASETLIKLMVSYLKTLKLCVDEITFVPLSVERQKDRGFNQAEILANGIGLAINIPVLNLLYRVKDTPKQSLLSQQERLTNLKDVFKVKSPHSLKGKTVLLIDDVFTTGTTLNECSLVLQKLKPEKIIAFTFAKTNFRQYDDGLV